MDALQLDRDTVITVFATARKPTGAPVGETLILRVIRADAGPSLVTPTLFVIGEHLTATGGRRKGRPMRRVEVTAADFHVQTGARS